MSPRTRKLYTFPIDDDLARALKAVKVLDGVSEAEQIREGIRLYLREKGYRRPAHHSWGKVADDLEEEVEKVTKATLRRASTRRKA